MRSFTKSEQEFLKNILALKSKGDLQKLQVATLLRESLDCLALKWEIEPKCRVELFFSKNSPKDEDWQRLIKEYFRIVDFIYLVDELVSLNLVRIQYISLDKDTKPYEKALYDRSKYQLQGDRFWRKGDVTGTCLYLVDSLVIKKVYNNFAKDLDKYANAIIYPLPELKDLADREFQTIEDFRYREQLSKTERSIEVSNSNAKSARYGVYVASLGILLSFVSLFVNKCSIQDINVMNYDGNSLNQSIQGLKHQTIDSVKNIDYSDLNKLILELKHQSIDSINHIDKSFKPVIVKQEPEIKSQQ